MVQHVVDLLSEDLHMRDGMNSAWQRILRRLGQTHQTALWRTVIRAAALCCALWDTGRPAKTRLGRTPRRKSGHEQKIAGHAHVRMARAESKQATAMAESGTTPRRTRSGCGADATAARASMKRPERRRHAKMLCSTCDDHGETVATRSKEKAATSLKRSP